MTTDGPRAGYAKGRATREEILVAATKLFGEVGYGTASLREVAARVGISHPGLMHHFANKAILLAAVLERRDEVDGVAFQADLADGVGFFDALARLAAATRRSRPSSSSTPRCRPRPRRSTTPRTPTSSSAARHRAGDATGEFERLRDAGRLRDGEGNRAPRPGSRSPRWTGCRSSGRSRATSTTASHGRRDRGALHRSFRATDRGRQHGGRHHHAARTAVTTPNPRRDGLAR